MGNYWTYLMVLNDGATYTDLKGCKIVRLRTKLFEGMDNVELYLPDAPVVRVFEDEPRIWDEIHEQDLHERLLKVRRRILEHDGWTARDLDTINEAIARLQ